MSLATLDGQTVTECSVQLPSWGVAWADVEIDQPTQLEGQVQLVVADLELTMTIMSGGPWQGRARYRLAAGAGGWGQELPSRAYQNDAGVKLSKVLTDVADACGETLGTVPTGTCGFAWTRPEAPASHTLSTLYPQGWYVDESGVTQIGTRASTTYTGKATRLPSDIAAGRLELAAEELAQLVPGATVDDLVAADVQHTIRDNKLRTTIWGALQSDTSRRVEAWRKLFEALNARNRWRGIWEYRVVSQSGERLNLQSVRSSTGMPDLLRVAVRPGIPGANATHKLGSLVLVAFVNGESSRPVVVGFDDADSPGFLPTATEIDASSTATLGASATTTNLGPSTIPAPRKGVARLDDLVLCGGFGGAITTASATVKAGA